MHAITLQDLKRRGANAIPSGQAIYLIVNSRPKAVLLPPEEYEFLLRSLEELEDAAAIAERRRERTIPFAKAFPVK